VHGNGPQVGNVLLQNEAGSQMFGLPAMPMDVCGAETQGQIGYMIEMGLEKVMVKENIDRNVVTFVTQVLVDKDDPMFKNPTKPVGPYYTEEEAEAYAKETGAIYKADPKGKGWRKVVASPKPIDIQNIKLVKRLAEEGNIVITVGGGGIPVIKKDGVHVGVEAVIDKDLASAMTAIKIGADELKNTFAAMSPQVKLSEVVVPEVQGAGGNGAATYSKLSEVPTEKLAELREKNPQEYKKLYKAEYGLECEI